MLRTTNHNSVKRRKAKRRYLFVIAAVKRLLRLKKSIAIVSNTMYKVAKGIHIFCLNAVTISP